MLQITDRPVWRTLKNGSNSYVKALIESFKKLDSVNLKMETNQAVLGVHRGKNSIKIKTKEKMLDADIVVMACHSDQSLNLLEDINPQEKLILEKVPYQKNSVVLHSDPSLMPHHSKAWASWNVNWQPSQSQDCQVTYFMNKLQNIDITTPILVTLNPNRPIDPKKVWAERSYSHPIFNSSSDQLEKQIRSLNGKNNTYFCGAYTGWGFHEDGVRSAKLVADQIEDSLL